MNWAFFAWNIVENVVNLFLFYGRIYDECLINHLKIVIYYESEIISLARFFYSLGQCECC